jgi:ketosteroid isomerase-like protein
MDELADPVVASYRALNERDIEGALAPLDEHAVWRESAELPGGGELRGKEAIEAFLREFLDTWSEFRQEVEEARVAGSRVLLLLHMRAVGRTSGIETDTRYAHLWTMQGGRGVLVEAYRDQDSAVRAFEDDSGATAP